MEHNKRLIVDFDDTLAHTKNRDWENAEPNWPLINKLNDLSNSGWTVDIFTARGSISCSSREEAAEKYSLQIRDWLSNNNVKYNTLSFNKPLGAYYIDDKGISPEDFITTDIRQLEGGLSGSDIYTDGKLVHKTDTNALAVQQWFSDVDSCLLTPKIERVVGDTITMEYIDHDEDFFINNFYVSLALIQESLDSMKRIPNSSPFIFSSYCDRIEDHAHLAQVHLYVEVVELLRTIWNLNSSFSHGDFGIKNMLFTEEHNELVLIDPIPNMFGCTELDVAKFLASLRVNYPRMDRWDMAFKTLATYNNIELDLLSVLTAAELIRIHKYHPEKEFIMEQVKYVFEQK
tara:strand:- start:130 stop:1164 length:1035 start_codon:yes stop_codon:yes gene_type:complete